MKNITVDNLSSKLSRFYCEVKPKDGPTEVTREAPENSTKNTKDQKGTMDNLKNGKMRTVCLLRQELVLTLEMPSNEKLLLQSLGMQGQVNLP